MKLPSRRATIRSIYFIVSVAIIVLLFPQKSKQHLSYIENRPWSGALLTAPFDIPVYRDSISVLEMTDSITVNFVPVYRLDKSADEEAVKKIDANKSLTPAEKRFILEKLSVEYAAGIVDNETYDKIVSGQLNNIRLLSNNELRSTPTATMMSQRQAYVELDSFRRKILEPDRIALLDISELLIPNILADSAENNRMLQDALLQANAAIGVIQQGERIIDRGDIVNPQLYRVLQTYEEMVETRDLTDTTELIYTDIGVTLYAILIFLCVYSFFFNYRRKWWENDSRMLCIMILLIGFYFAAVILGRAFATGMLIVPFTILPILVTVFYDSRTALFSYMMLILLCLPLTSFAMEFAFIEFIAGLAAVFSMKELSRRSQLVLTACWVFIAYSFAYFAVELLISGTITTLSWKAFGSFLINAVLISFAYILIFIVEKIFGFTSMVTLVELSDINNNLLQELSEQCPGTFQHSMAVSNLAADAARKIGANVQLVRTGALYHDIGKLANPAFFTENQYGVNPHDNLSPEQSAKIIIGHIKEGMKRAEKSNLPSVVKDMITQHHGAGKAKYFYLTECKRKGVENVNPDDFTYPGPNPQTLEASLIMMADSVEAASRSLPDHSTEAITELVNRIIDSQIAEGLHAESPLSFRDIALIKQTFINRLRTMYHARIAYPSDIKPKA